MGERLVVKFCKEGWTPEALVYLHWGGETQREASATLDQFFADVRQVGDPRLGDPSYLAAKLVVWAAGKSRRSEHPLDFLSVGVVTSDDWGDAVAVVDCDEADGSYWFERALADGPELGVSRWQGGRRGGAA